MFLDTIRKLNMLEVCPKVILLTEPLDQRLSGLVKEDGWKEIIQSSCDFSGKMVEAFMGTGMRDRPVLLSVSDAPFFDDVKVASAVTRAKLGEAFIGPSPDGGFNMVCFRPALAQDAFDGVAWSTSYVLSSVLRNLSKAGYNVNVLDAWPDLDDLGFFESLSDDSIQRMISSAPQTMKALKGALRGRTDLRPSLRFFTSPAWNGL